MLQRMLIDRMENRILVGITMFVAIMLLVGWVAINENARMASFERQYEGRSIEHGAELFAANCATCHGNDGRGINGRAPALNSPHLFGFDFFVEIDRELDALDDEQAALDTELAELADELVEAGITQERIDEIAARRQEISEIISGEGGLESRRAELEEEKAAIVAQLQPAIANGYPIREDIDEDGNSITVIESSRLAQVGWGGTLEDYIFTTLVHGRPTSISYWEAPMVAWSRTAGGPLRDDQLQNITNYILNYDKGDDWTIADALAVDQYARVPGLGGGTGELVAPAGSDAVAILARIEEEGIVGDVANGEALYIGSQPGARSGIALGCSGCHAGGTNGPPTEGTWDRVLNERLTLEQFADYTPEQYLIESIVAPSTYIAPGYNDGIMPGTFGQSTSIQDIADLVAYLETTTNGE